LSKHVLQILPQATKLPRRAQAGDEPLTLSIVLNRNDQAGYDSFISGFIHSTGSAPAQFVSQTDLSNRFGPSQQDYDAVLAYLQQSGFALSDGSDNRLTITVHGTRAQAEQAFAISIDDYQLDGRTFYAHDTEPAVPIALASKVRAISGLSNLAQPHPSIGPGATVSANPSPALPASTLTAYDWRTAPGADGTGWTIGLPEFDMFNGSDVSNWLNLAGLPASIINQLSVVPVNGGTVPSGGQGTTEALLDIDTVMGIAPGARYVVAVAPGAPQCNCRGTPMIDLLNGLVNAVNRGTGASKALISNSWDQCEVGTSQSDAESIDSLMQAAVASDIYFFNASGDYGSACVDGSGLVPNTIYQNTVSVPADGPNGTAVGGTALQVDANNNWQSESWWGTGCPSGQKCASGFGVSSYFGQPSYQNGFTGASGRSVPDMVAESTPGVTICQGACPASNQAGTSLAAPLVAASLADVSSEVGYTFAGPANLYWAAQHSGASVFHSAASMGSDFAHVGLGSPDFARMAQDLAGVQVKSVSPNSGPTSGGQQVTVTGGPFNVAPSQDTFYFDWGSTYTNPVIASCQTVLQCKVTTPNLGSSGVVDVAASTPNAETSAQTGVHYSFLPSVISISPSHVPFGVQKNVTITGSGLNGSIYFGAVQASAPCSGTSCTVTTPDVPGPGTYEVKVCAGGLNGACSALTGTSCTQPGTPSTPCDAFTFDGPTIVSVSPAVLRTTGDWVGVTGSGLGNFDGSPATISAMFEPTDGSPGFAASTIACSGGVECGITAPPCSAPHCTTAANSTMDVVVTVDGVATARTSADQVSYKAWPTVTGVSPTSGLAKGGTAVTVSGTNFDTSGGTTIKVGTAAVTITDAGGKCASTTACHVSTPVGGGAQDVTVTVNGATSDTNSADKFSYIPMVTSISPASGKASGYDTVTISGYGLTQSSGGITFGSAAVNPASASCSSWTTCTVTSPAGGGAVDVRVTVNSFTSAATGTTCTQPGTPSAPCDAYTYQPVTIGPGWTKWGLSGSMPTSIAGPASVYDAAHQSVVLVDVDTDPNDGPAALQTWTWDGSSGSWTLHTPATSPSVRTGETLVYDAARGKVVLFGGESGYPGSRTVRSPLNDTYVWDGTNWTQASPSSSPPARWFGSAAYDDTHKQVVLFGGATSAGTLGDTWVWDGATWTQKSPTASPSARSGNGLAYDAANGTVVLFGGGAGGNILSDTWAWDGTNWTHKNTTASPSARNVAGLAYDASRGGLLLFGGDTSTSGSTHNYQSDTWLWDGTNWSQVSTSATPPAQAPLGMSADPATGGVEFIDSSVYPLSVLWLGK
jgi:hypothetical protein